MAAASVYAGFAPENVHMKTLFLHPPSFGGYDGGAGARYQMKREVRSFWYPTWLAQPAALVEGSKLIDAPPHRLQFADIAPEVHNRDLVVMHTSTPSFNSDVKVAAMIKSLKPDIKIGLIGAKVAVEPEKSLLAAPANTGRSPTAKKARRRSVNAPLLITACAARPAMA